MDKLSYILFFVIIVTTSGCNKNYLDFNEPLKSTTGLFVLSTNQAKTWQDYCLELALEINNELVEQDYISTPIYISPTCTAESPCNDMSSTKFDKVYKDLLTSQLVSIGVPVSDIETEETLTINYQTKIVNDAQFKHKGGELVITSTIIRNNKYIHSSSAILDVPREEYIYFIPDADMGGYRLPISQEYKTEKIKTKIKSNKVKDPSIFIQPMPIV